MKEIKQKHVKFDKENLHLDKEEQDLLDSLERGEWKTIDNFDEELALAKAAARNTFRKDTNVNIRISSVDLQHIKQKAAYEGLKYQTLIASVLHKYAAGHLKAND